MKALVTGTEGFVAPYLIKELISKRYEVIGTYKTKPSFKNKKTNLIYLDITKKKEVSILLKKYSPDVIFHLAAINDLGFSIKNPNITKKVNVEGTKNILKYSQKGSTVVCIGSAQEYGFPEEKKIKETHPLNPTNPYGESKKIVEKIAPFFSQNIRIVLLRSFNHIGPGQNEMFVCSGLAKQIAKIEKGDSPILFVGNLKAKRDFTDVRDIVKAYILSSKKCAPLVPYNVCSGKAYEIGYILKVLLKYSNIKIKIKIDKSKIRETDIPFLVGNPTKFYIRTGWKQKIPITKSLLDILNYWRKVNSY